jgi:hypothetical protein
VAGRRVVAWPREPMTSGISSPASTGAPAAARELTLPQTDLAHKADLVELFYEEGAQVCFIIIIVAYLPVLYLTLGVPEA